MRQLIYVIIILALYHRIPNKISAQPSVTGIIIDADSGASIANVKIKNQLKNDIIYSNHNGDFILSEPGVYIFSKMGYQTVSYKLENLKNKIIIQLTINPSELNEIVVHASHIPIVLKKSVNSIQIITKNDINKGNTINFTDVINRIPGVFMQSGALNTNKITIRGIGSRTLYGTSKIRAYFQDIPLTSGNGETTIEDLELSSISRIEIIKGAGSSIYGAGLGGSIHLIPQKGFLNQTNIDGTLTLGSFGLNKNMLQVNHGKQNNHFNLVYSNTNSKGYRENSNYNRETITLNSNHFLNKNDELSFLGSFVDLKGYIPSSINQNAFDNNPKSAAFTWKQAEGFEESKQGILGLTWTHRYHPNLKQVTSLFSKFNDNFEPRPFNILNDKTLATGIRSRLIGSLEKLDWTLGFEYFIDIYNTKTFENLYQYFPIGTGSVAGEILSNFEEKRNYLNLFFDFNYNLTEKTLLSIGLNQNSTKYAVNDRLFSKSSLDQSGTFQFKNIISPKMGFSHEFSKKINVFTTISHGFSPPTTTETLLPDGLINTNIKPESGWNYEIGTRTVFLNNQLQFNLTYYHLDLKNLIVARRTGNDEFIGVNAGKTQHSGLEIDIKSIWLESNKLFLKHYLSYTFNHHKFVNFIDNDVNYSGKKLSGIPQNQLNTGFDFDSNFGLYGTINYQFTDQIPITDNNTLFTNKYALTNIKLGYKKTFKDTIKINTYFGLDNVFNKHYASQILINAVGFGGSAPRYFYPGYPINYYTGLSINYKF